MRLTRTRMVSQGFFLGLFLFLMLCTESERMRGYPVSLFLNLSPLSAVATAIAARTLYAGMILSLLVLVPTLFLGRFFCGWVCPLGTLNQIFSRLLGPRGIKERIASNRYRRVFALKYYMLAAGLVLAGFGITQVGLLDPISFLTRSMATSVLPAVGEATGGRALPERAFQYGWLLGGLLAGVLMLNAVIPRFYCRVICPLGALLGVMSRLGLFRVVRSEKACIHCERCMGGCQGASDPHAKLRKSECLVCMECRQVCPTQAITFGATAPEGDICAAPDLSRRTLLKTAIVAAVGAPLVRASVGAAQVPPNSLIRPPGSEPESGFLSKCVKCGQCMKVCPTRVIQPALFGAGIEGVWTPVMVFRLGYCEYNCNLCSTVCPTGAIREFTLARKHGLPPHERPIKLGTAFVDRTRCLPWAMNIPCIVCEEMCPVSPKAIYIETAEVVNSEGRRVTVQRPVVDPARCIGCGLCENRCPVHDLRAIRVSSVGESRSATNRLLLQEGRSASEDG